jgi:hypothetical protein
MSDAFDELSRRLSTNPSIRLDLTRYDSGSIVLDIFPGDRFFTLLYREQYGYGVDEILDDEAIPPFSDYYRYWFPTFDEAANKLAELMANPPAVGAGPTNIAPAVTPAVNLTDLPATTPHKHS